MRHSNSARECSSISEILKLVQQADDVSAKNTERDNSERGITDPLASSSFVDDDAESFSLSGLLPDHRIFGGDDVVFRGIAESSGTCLPGQLVVAEIGIDDPCKVAADAMARGAAGILTEQLIPCSLPQCVVGSVASAIGCVNHAMLGRPDTKLLTIGVLGSAGKTSTALLISSLLRNQKTRVAYQTDLGCSDGVLSETPDAGLRTETDYLHWLADSVDSGSQAAVIELHDESLRQGTFDHIEFDVLIIAGAAELSDDFGPCGLQCALECLASSGVVIAPADDKKTMRPLMDSGCRIVTYSATGPADLSVTLIEQSCGLTTLLLTSTELSTMLETPLCGAAMACNIAAAATLGVLLDQPLYEIAESLSNFRELPGRGQRLSDFGRATVLLDAGGSPERVAATLRNAYRMKSGGRLWCVLAMTDNDSDADLSMYGQILERYADNCVVSCDGSAKRGFLKQSHAVLDGVQKCAAIRLVADQRRAVTWAVSEAQPRDTIVVIGGISGGSPREQRLRIDTIGRWVEDQRKEESDAMADVAPEPEAKSIKLSIFRPEN